MATNASKLIKTFSTFVLFTSLSCYGAEEASLFGSFTTTLLNTDNTAVLGQKGTTAVNQLTLNGEYRLSDSLSLVGAINVSNLNAEDYHTNLDYASFNYTKNLGSFFEGSFRFGRIKHDIGLFENERNNPTSRMMVYLPFATYWPAFEHLAQSSDGVQVELKKYADGFGLFSFSSTYGTPVIHKEDGKYIMFGYFHHFADNNRIRENGYMLSNTLAFQTQRWEIKYNRTSIPLKHNFSFAQFWIDPANYSITEPNQMDQPVYPLIHNFQTLGVRYIDENVCVGGEIVKHDFPTEPIGVFLRACSEVGPKTRVGITASKFFHRNASQGPTPVPGWYRNGESIGVSLTHNINPRTTLKAEYHQGDGTAWFPYPASSAEWDLLAISLSYKFDLLK